MGSPLTWSLMGWVLLAATWGVLMGMALVWWIWGRGRRPQDLPPQAPPPSGGQRPLPEIDPLARARVTERVIERYPHLKNQPSAQQAKVVDSLVQQANQFLGRLG